MKFFNLFSSLVDEDDDERNKDEVILAKFHVHDKQ